MAHHSNPYLTLFRSKTSFIRILKCTWGLEEIWSGAIPIPTKVKLSCLDTNLYQDPELIMKICKALDQNRKRCIPDPDSSFYFMNCILQWNSLGYQYRFPSGKSYRFESGCELVNMIPICSNKWIQTICQSWWLSWCVFVYLKSDLLRQAFCSL